MLYGVLTQVTPCAEPSPSNSGDLKKNEIKWWLKSISISRRILLVLFISDVTVPTRRFVFEHHNSYGDYKTL